MLGRVDEDVYGCERGSATFSARTGMETTKASTSTSTLTSASASASTASSPAAVELSGGVGAVSGHREYAPVPKGRKKRLSRRDWWLIVVLIALPIALMALKATATDLGSWLSAWLSFEALPHAMRGRATHLLFAPLGAVVVVLFRLTFGIRVLGPFRSVLLAIAFEMTGAGVGLAFFAIVIAVVMLVRPVFKRMKLPYFGRSAALLISVAGVIVLTMLVGLVLGLTSVERVAYFPIVVLTLTGEAFAGAYRREGAKSAFWRAGATAGLAVGIAVFGSIESVREYLMAYPELVCLELACVPIICEYLNLRLFQHLNPRPVKKKKKGKAGGGSAVAQTAPARS